MDLRSGHSLRVAKVIHCQTEETRRLLDQEQVLTQQIADIDRALRELKLVNEVEKEDAGHARG